MIEEKIIEISIDKNTWQFVIYIDLRILLIAVLIIAIVCIIIKLVRSRFKDRLVKEDIVPVELNFELGGISTKYQIVRNYTNIEIAHRIFIELITRKAAIEIDKTNDVIEEVYNSWYILFQITRNELKTLTGDLLYENEKAADLIKLMTDILNKGLRPHLTLYQAKFRKWFKERLIEEESKDISNRLSPQEIQEEYPDYSNLIDSMQQVNQLLIDYVRQLKGFISKN